MQTIKSNLIYSEILFIVMLIIVIIGKDWQWNHQISVVTLAGALMIGLIGNLILLVIALYQITKIKH